MLPWSQIGHKHTNGAAVEVFTLRYPGVFPDALPDDQKRNVDALPRVCESHLADAAVGLALFDEAQQMMRDFVEQMVDKAATISPFQRVEGEWPWPYRTRVSFIHAHTVLYALDGIGKCLKRTERLHR